MATPRVVVGVVRRLRCEPEARGDRGRLARETQSSQGGALVFQTFNFAASVMGVDLA